MFGLLPLSGAGHQYPFVPQDAGGLGPSHPYFAAIDEAVTQKMPNYPFKLGQILGDRYGNVYMYMHAAAAIAQGVVVKMRANPTAGTVAATDTVADNKAIVKADFASITAGREVGNWLFFRTLLKLKLIKGNTATASTYVYFTISKKSLALGRPGTSASFYDGDYESTVTTADTVDLIRPYNVDVCGAAGVPFGVAPQAISSGQRGLIQIAGVALVLSIGSTDALVDNAIVVTAASGKVKGPLGAGITGTEATAVVGIAKSAYAGASALCPVQLTLGVGRM
jgi:hypothetical protein